MKDVSTKKNFRFQGVKRGGSVLLVQQCVSTSRRLAPALIEAGLQISAKVEGTAELLLQIGRWEPDLLVLDIDCLGSDLLNRLARLHCKQPLPVVVFARKDAPHLVRRAVEVGVCAYVVDRDCFAAMFSIVNMAVACFDERQRLQSALARVEKKLAQRKVLERAKGLLMRQRGIDENQAYTLLRKMAMDKRLPMAVVAKDIVDICSLLEQ